MGVSPGSSQAPVEPSSFRSTWWQEMSASELEQLAEIGEFLWWSVVSYLLKVILLLLVSELSWILFLSVAISDHRWSRLSSDWLAHSQLTLPVLFSFP